MCGLRMMTRRVRGNASTHVVWCNDEHVYSSIESRTDSVIFLYDYSQ
jgi:hypothetical protein